MTAARLGAWLFAHRGFLGVPLFLLALIFARPEPQTWLWGGLLILMGEGLRVWAVAYSGPKTRARTLVADRLTTDGPYRWVRNPIYWGNFFVGEGLVVISRALWPWLPLLFVPLFWAEYTLIVLAEEAFLVRRFGEAYRRYCAAVPRFVPRPGRVWPSQGVHPNWPEALRSERSTFWVIGALLVLFSLRSAIRL